MKAVVAAAGALCLLILGIFGVGNTVLTSVPFADDEQRAMYDDVVREYRLTIPGSVLLAVDTVRFHQDFAWVGLETVRQTAELFSACGAFDPLIVEGRGKGRRVAFRVPRSGEVEFGAYPEGVTAELTDAEGRSYANHSTLAAGDYWIEVTAPSESTRYESRVYLDLVPCGQQEISDVLDRLGLVGDDRAMVYHLIAMYLPKEENYGHIMPGPFVWPVADTWPITSPFGERLDPVTGEWRVHTGVDIGVPEGKAVHVATDGVVVLAGWDGNYGNAVRVAHGDGVTTVYGHLKTVLVTVGQHVGKGDSVGLVGSTGKSTGPHLHFEWRVNGEPIDPLTVYHWTPEETP